MDSLSVTATLSLGGYAQGVTSDPDLATDFPARLAAALASTGTGAAKANQGLWYRNRTLAAGSETFDLTNFTNALKEAGASLSKVRIYYFEHSSSSVATSVTVGGAASPFAGPKDTPSATETYKPGEGFLLVSPTTNGWPVSAGQGIKVAATGGTATYTIGVFGE